MWSFPGTEQADCQPPKTALPWKHIEMHDIRHGTICQSWVMAQIAQNGSYSGWCCKTLRLSSIFRQADFLNQTLLDAGSQRGAFASKNIKRLRHRTKGFFWINALFTKDVWQSLTCWLPLNLFWLMFCIWRLHNTTLYPGLDQSSYQLLQIPSFCCNSLCAPIQCLATKLPKSHL